jgi:PAS domain-containing protein
MSTPPRRTTRRRVGSTARRYRPSDLAQVSTQPKVSREAILTAIAVSIVGAALIALIWLMAQRSAAEYRVLMRHEVENGLSAQAATLAEKVKLELQVVDQTLTIIQALWNENPGSFRLADWHNRVPALTSVSDDIFIADDKRIIQQDILPQAVGQGIGGAYLPFPHGSLEVFDADGERTREGRIVTPTSNATVEARRYLVYVVRPLGSPARAIVGASFRSGEITRHFADATLGTNGIVLLIDQKQGLLQAVAGPASRRPRVNLTGTDMLDVMSKASSGTWSGPTGVDNTPRIHAWAKVPGRDSIVVVGTPIAQAMAPAEAIATGTFSVAAMASGVVAAAGMIVAWGLATLRGNRRRQRNMERAQADLSSAQADMAASRLLAATATTQLRALLDGVTEAAAVFDADMRLATWNDRFIAASGLPEDSVKEGLPLDEMLRRQHQAGLFMPQAAADADPEAEIARRTQSLLASEDAEPLTQLGPGGTPIPVLSKRMPDTGLVLILGGLAEWQAPPRRAEPAPQPAQAQPAAETAGAANVVEW